MAKKKMPLKTKGLSAKKAKHARKQNRVFTKLKKLKEKHKAGNKC